MKRSKYSFHDFSAKHTPSATLKKRENTDQDQSFQQRYGTRYVLVLSKSEFRRLGLNEIKYHTEEILYSDIALHPFKARRYEWLWLFVVGHLLDFLTRWSVSLNWPLMKCIILWNQSFCWSCAFDTERA